MKHHVAVASLALVLSIAYLVGALSMPLGDLDDPGPGAYPALLGGVASIISLVYVWRSAREIHGGRTDTRSSPTDRRLTLSPAAKLLVSLLLYAVLLPVAGFMVSAFALMALSLRAMGHRGWTCGLAAVAISLLAWLVFDVWLKIPFPELPL